jgi:5-methyltetrahydropteroyltriglutamate--homocysteine methyltransferase
VSDPRWTKPITVEDWRFAESAAADAARERGGEKLPVKATLVGPYSLARLSDLGDLDRERVTMALAEALREEIRALFAAGAPVVQIDENALTLIADDDDGERRMASEALRRLTDGVEGHVTLAVTMGSAEPAGASLFFDLPFASYLFDLIAGPDNWRLIARAPGDRGIVAGVADARNTRPDDESLMIWAARYAAGLSNRGLDRVGLSPSTGLEYLPRDRAKQKIEALGQAAAKAATRDPEELKRALDPRAVDARTAALGRYAPAGAAASAGATGGEEGSR